MSFRFAERHFLFLGGLTNKMLKKLKRMGIIFASLVFSISILVGISMTVQDASAEEVDNQETVLGTLGTHDCALLGAPVNTATAVDFGLVNQQALNELMVLMEQFRAQTEATGNSATLVCHYALAEDVSWEIAELPENVYIGVCLNGHKANGEFLLPDSGNAGMFTFDCSASHVCATLSDSLVGLSQGQIDFLPYWLMNGGSLGNMDAHNKGFALMSDVEFGPFWQDTMSGASFLVCYNGYTLTGGEILGATINGFNCHTQGQDHTCSALGNNVFAVGLNEVPMTEENTIVEVIQSGSDSTKTIYTKKSDSFTPYASEKGVFFGYGTEENPLYGTYTFALNEDISLAKTLTIPAGMDIHICLNGYTLTGPAIRLYVNEDKEDIVSAFSVQAGASLTICDCSADNSGKIKSKMDDFEAETTGGWEGLGTAIALMLTPAITNQGSVELNGGQVISMVGILNQGDVVVNGGELVGAVSSVFQGVDEQLGAVEDGASITVNDGVLAGGMVGLYGAHGEIAINGGEIKSLANGILAGSDLNGNPIAESASMDINGGSIVFDTAIINVFMDEYGEFIEELNVADISLGDTVAIATNGDLNLNKDVDIVYTEEFLALQEISAELDTAKRQEEADANLAPGEESVPVDPTVYTSTDIRLNESGMIRVQEEYAYKNQYTVSADSGQAIVDKPVSGTFIIPDGHVMIYDDTGKGIIVEETEDLVYPAKVAGATVSTDGTIKMNFYVTVTEGTDISSVKLGVVYKGAETVYTLSTEMKKGNYYMVSTGICAKDYQETLTCKIYATMDFGSGARAVHWEAASVTLEEYLDVMLEDETGTYDDAKMLCLAMKNYCMAASALFGVSAEYVCLPQLQEYVDMVTEEILASMAMRYSGNSDKVTLSGATLLLESTTAIRIYFTLKESTSINDVTVTVDGVEMKAALASGTTAMYYVEIPNIAAANLGQTYEICIDGYTVNYSAMSYAYSVLSTQPNTSKSVDVVKAMCIYSAIASEYFNS